MIAALFICTLAASYELRAAAGVTPVQKVLQLMSEMKAKAIQEKQDEEVAFSSFKQWCTNTAQNKAKAIKKAEELMEQLSADIAAADSDVQTLTDEIEKLDAEIIQKTDDMKSTTEIRESEHADYEKTHLDYSESIDAVTRAEAVMSKQAAPTAQAMMLLQTVRQNKMVSPKAGRVLDSFLAMGAKQDPMSVTAPEAAAYTFQSSGVVDMLVKLREEFEDKRGQLEKDEMEAKHASEMMMQDLQDTIEKLTKQKGRKTQRKAQREEDAATARGELEETTTARNEDKKYLEEAVAGCETKSSDFAERNKLRGEEIEAIEKAIEIIGGEAVSGSADKHLPSLVQKTSFSLLRSTTSSRSMGRVAEYLSQKAYQLNSRMLSMIAVQARGSPFDKVKKMIKDMIVKLMEEATAETEHKGWCDGELGANKVQREAKTEDVNQLQAEADQLTADIAKLSQELADVATEISELDKAVAEATKIRAEENAKNTATIADAKAAQEAVKSALGVLKDFYAKAAEATALVQAPSAMDDAPETFDAPFKGQQSESGGVMGMLEVILSDFSRLESETSAEEESAADEYKKFSSESAVDRATMVAETDQMNKLKTRKDGQLTQTKKDLKNTQAELDAAHAYYDKLKPSCVDSGVSYEERVERREAEIQSLQEALKILSGEDI